MPRSPPGAYRLRGRVVGYVTAKLRCCLSSALQIGRAGANVSLARARR